MERIPGRAIGWIVAFPQVLPALLLMAQTDEIRQSFKDRDKPEMTFRCQHRHLTHSSRGVSYSGPSRENRKLQ
jgi:hypothetical protein